VLVVLMRRVRATGATAATTKSATEIIGQPPGHGALRRGAGEEGTRR
jgi:hypothetical protein